MAITDESGGMIMPVQPMYGNQNNGGFGFGGDWAWILLLLVLGGGWGGFGGFGGMNGAMAGGIMGMDMLYPWLNNSEHISDGFRDQQLSAQVGNIQNAVTSGFGDIQTALCGGFAGVNAAITQAQIANMERSFAAQTANTSGMTALQAQLAQCCCDNRLATAQTQNIVQAEGAASRASASADTQKILDKLCALELDGVKGQLAQAQRENVALQNAVNMATMQASQVAQTAQIREGQNASVNALVQELRSCPIPSQPVYGSQPIFTCPNNNNSGCGCGF